MTVSPILLEINHAEVSFMEWGMSCEEVLGGTGRATLIVQDKTNSWEPQAHWDVKVSVRSNGWVLFRGEIIFPHADLPVGFPWTRWVLDCADYNDEMPQRKVGALDGVNWVDADASGTYVNIDTNAQSSGDDKSTVQALIAAYIRVDGQALETSTYVNSYVSVDPPIYWEYTDLQSALEELASEVTVNVQFWIDPDLYFHWQAIPAWQDLAQEAVAIELGLEAPMARMLPEASLGSLGISPLSLSSVRGLTSETVGCRDLQFAFDGTSMPQQVYVKGGTGYVYNNGVGQYSTVPAPTGPTPVFPGKYEINFNATTLVYSRNSQGFIQLPGVPFTPSPSTVFYGNPQVIPFDPVHQTGGSFYNMKTGPYAGYLVSFWTNSLGYGDVTVALAGAASFCAPPPAPPAPALGTSGSGWANEITQDPNMRQAYFEAPMSTSRALRDSFGAQVLYRGSRPTLRGSCKVGGYDEDGNIHEGADGWRVGQLVQITDERLPASLNGRFFVIQRVQSKLIATTDVREYTLDWGDGPVSRFSAQKRERPSTPPPTIGVLVTEEDVAPAPLSSQKITGQLINKAGLPWAIADKTVNWELLVLDSGGNVCDQGSLSPMTSTTDRNGTAYTTLTAGAGLGLTYFVYATVPVT